MAKISAADASRPLMEAFAKYHFWLLALVVPSVLLPLLFLARGDLAAKIETQRGAINGHIKAMKDVRAIPQHPNESWTNDIDNSTMRVKRETFAEWRKFWESQRLLRAWPPVLGADFLQTVEALKPDGKLSRKLLERYQNNAVALVRELPKRMGVADAIAESLAPGQPQGPGPEPSRPPVGPAGERVEETPYFSSWNMENQNRVAESFKWAKVPSTTQVLLAQEELWVYGLLCDTVARMNKAATGPHNAAIVMVNELLVGYPAAEDNPGGQAGGRIRRVMAGPGQMDAGPGGPPMPGMGPPMPGMGPPAGEGGAGGGRPPHPRFGATQRGGPPMPAQAPEEGAAAVSPDDQLRNWIYVNFEGRPLDAAALAAAPDCQMVHLVPFVLRVVMDERLIDSLLVELSSASVPIDVRQVRINAGGAGPVGGRSVADGGGVLGGGASLSSAGRLHDVDLELRGTVGLATPPDEKAVGLEPGQGSDAATENPGEMPAPAPQSSRHEHSRGRRVAS
ncbi:MAG: hypothetical protein ACKOK8_08150 [Planctomycetia bacterium]